MFRDRTPTNNPDEEEKEEVPTPQPQQPEVRRGGRAHLQPVLPQYVVTNPDPKQLKTVAIDCGSSGDNTIIAGVDGCKIKVYHVVLVVTGAVNVIWKSGSTLLSGAMNFANKGEGYASAIQPPAFLIETAVGEALKLNLSAAVAVDGMVSYWDSDTV